MSDLNDQKTQAEIDKLLLEKQLLEKQLANADKKKEPDPLSFELISSRLLSLFAIVAAYVGLVNPITDRLKEQKEKDLLISNNIIIESIKQLDEPDDWKREYANIFLSRSGISSVDFLLARLDLKPEDYPDKIIETLYQILSKLEDSKSKDEFNIKIHDFADNTFQQYKRDFNAEIKMINIIKLLSRMCDQNSDFYNPELDNIEYKLGKKMEVDKNSSKVNNDSTLIIKLNSIRPNKYVRLKKTLK